MKESKFTQIANVRPFLKNPQKCTSEIVTIRSSWEFKFILKYLDINENIISWGSEAKKVRYIKPSDGKYHTYYIDFNFIAKTKDGKLKEFWVEIKPQKEIILPVVPKRKTKSYIYQVTTYLTNVAKWEATKKLVEHKNNNGEDVTFQILSEKDCPWFLS